MRDEAGDVDEYCAAGIEGTKDDFLMHASKLRCFGPVGLAPIAEELSPRAIDLGLEVRLSSPTPPRVRIRDSVLLASPGPGSAESGSPREVPEESDFPQFTVTGELAMLSERLLRLESQVSSYIGGYLEDQIAKVMEAGRRDAQQRRELANLFAAAIQEERDERIKQFQQLHEVVSRSPPAHLGDDAGECPAAHRRRSVETGAAGGAADTELCRTELSALSESVEALGRKISEDLSEQHAQAALDLADRHLEAAQALDSRSVEIARYADTLQREVTEFGEKLCDQVAAIVRSVLEGVVSVREAPSEEEPARQRPRSAPTLGDAPGIAAAHAPGPEGQDIGLPSAVAAAPTPSRVGSATACSHVGRPTRVWGMQFLKDNGCLLPEPPP